MPRTLPSPEREADRHKHEVEWWAAHIDEMVKRLPNLRRIRGDQRAGWLARDVIEELRAAQGEDAAVLARDRLRDVWRRAGRGRP